MSPVHQLAFGTDALAWLAEHIIDTHRASLPDLSRVVVLLPQLQAAPALQRRLLEAARKAGHPALLGPEISTLRQHIERELPWERPIIGHETRRLILVDALREHPELFNHGNPWNLADALLELFDQLNLAQQRLPASLDDFITQLQRAYRTQNEALSREARLVHTLWQAWQQQLDALNLTDLNTAYLLKLGRHQPQRHYYLAGHITLSPAERHWLHRAMARQRAQVLIHGQPLEADAPPGPLLAALPAARRQQNGDDAYSRLLDAVFNPGDDSPLAERARRFASQYPRSPAQKRLSLLSAQHFGDEAQGIVLQILHWRRQGIQHIGLVIEDRLLARRLRALLERHGIALKDASGWALSTTAAAAALENWLACLEEDFAHRPLLDLLKSAFLPDIDLRQVHHLERDIIQYENIGRNLGRYRRAIESRSRRLNPARPIDHAPLLTLLQHLETAAQPLLALRRGRTRSSTFIQALRQSLSLLGLERGLSKDPAGQELLRILGDLEHAARHSHLPLSWQECRDWLGRALEQQNVNPPDPHRHYVELLQLASSGLARYQALVIASLSREHLPGGHHGGPFFNNAVRQELGLPTRRQQQAEQLHHFRRLLEAAPRILLSHHRGEHDTPPSPWLERLRSFHLLAWRNDLLDSRLHAWLEHGPPQRLPERPQPRPAPSLPAAAFPASLSTSAHQQLIDCPYAFFAARGLGLEAIEEIREAMQKNDYGQRVHRCLEAFHHDIPGLPGPFGQAVTADNRQAAIDCLQNISQAVFRHDIEDDFRHRGWLKRWQNVIPHYIDWEIRHQTHWRFQNGELKVQRDYLPGHACHGRLDRLDQRRDGGGFGIVDYKTGRYPRRQDVLAGEAVQLIHYACASTFPIGQVQYLDLDRSPGTPGCPLSGDELDKLQHRLLERLRQLTRAIENGAALPAWGDESTCRHCRMKGLCRRGLWWPASSEPGRQKH